MRYLSTWSPGADEVRCPADIADALNRAWDMLNVKKEHREIVLGPRRGIQEWRSFALVVARGLAHMGMGGVAAAKELERLALLGRNRDGGGEGRAEREAAVTVAV